MNEKTNILIIDDDDAIRDSCTQVFKKEGYQVKEAENGGKGLKILKAEFFHVIFLDLKLPDTPGMDILSHIKEETPETPVIIITGFASVDSAVEAMKRGAFDYLAKPFSPEELRVITKKALGNRKIFLENLYLRKELEARSEFETVVGKSSALEKVLDVVRRVSPTETTVLITGESGTGKELIAREIHNRSTRKQGPFVAVDCGALVESLFESELFGHVKGSFTGAYETKFGRFEVAHGGTIFFDEISNISINIQSNLLRVIQERELTRIGSAKLIKVDVRILAATNKNLEEAVRSGKFREDLFYRLSVVPIHIPPLRERKQDIHLLVEHFLQKYNKRAKKNIYSISGKVIKALMEYDWPGNIRELENTIERAVVLSQGNEIEIENLMYQGMRTRSDFYNPTKDKFKKLDEIEQEYIEAVLQAQSGNKTKTAEILGIDRKTLWSKIRKYNIK